VKKSLLFLLCLSGCGLLRESEPRAFTISAKATSAVCDLGTVKELKDRDVDQARLEQTIDCLEKKLDHAYDSIRGARPGEISVAEIRKLYDAKILKLPDEVDQWWGSLEVLLPLFHPEGRPAVVHQIGKQVLAQARRDIGLFRRARKIDSNNRPTWLADIGTWDSAEAWMKFISPSFELTLPKALTVAKSLKLDVRDIDAAWIVKNFVLIDAKEKVTGKNIRTLLAHGIESGRLIPQLQLWATDHTLPQNIPKGLVEEAGAVAAVWKRYFGENTFAPIDKDLLAWSLDQLDPRSKLSTLAGDLVRVSQRLSPPNQKERGLHPKALVPLLDQLPEIARGLQKAALGFGECKDFYGCETTLRKASKNSALKLVALKGRREWWPGGDGVAIPAKRLEMPFSWRSAMERLTERAFVVKLFSVFDKNQDGKLSLEASSEEELAEVLDLGFTFLRFITLESSSPSHDEKEEKVAAMVPIKPGPLTKVLGLLGDRWMPDGDQDRTLSADEFFSVVKIYDDILERTRDAGYMNKAEGGLLQDGKASLGYFTSELVYPRKDFIKSLPEAVLSGFPHLKQELKIGTPVDLESLFHAVIPIPSRNPVQVYHRHLTGQPSQTLTHYLQSPDAIAPVAIFTVLDRLMVRCDTDENGQLDWRELDCAVPLVLEGGLQTVSSGLIEIDAGPHDAARALLGFLQAPGTPLTAAKLLIANGSVTELQLDDDFGKLVAWMDNELQITQENLARFIAGRKIPAGAIGLWLAEAAKRYGHCDADKNGVLQGKKEVACFSDAAVEQIMASAVALGAQAANQLDLLKHADSIRLGLSLATQPEESVDLLLYKLGIHSNSPRILNLLEQIIRRSVPLWQLPD